MHLLKTGSAVLSLLPENKQLVFGFDGFIVLLHLITTLHSNTSPPMHPHTPLILLTSHATVSLV